MKTNTVYSAYDIKSRVTTERIEGQLRVSYSDETAYLDGLVASAWGAVTDFIGAQFGAATMTFEAEKFDDTFVLPVDADRISAITVEMWDGTTWNAVEAANINYSTIGTPTTVKLTTSDDAIRQKSATDTFAIMRGTVTITEEDPAPAVEQAFLLKLTDMYENREDTIVGTVSQKHPQGFAYLLRPYVKYNF